jgi:hypothetical protein
MKHISLLATSLGKPRALGNKLDISISKTFGQLAFMDIDTKWHPTKLSTIANYYGTKSSATNIVLDVIVVFLFVIVPIQRPISKLC